MNNTVAAVILLYTKILGEGVMLSSIHSSMAKRFCANIPTRLTEIMVQRGSVPITENPGRENEQLFPTQIPGHMAPGLSAKIQKPESLVLVYGNPPHIIIEPDLMDEGVREFQPTVLNPGFYYQTSETSGSPVLRLKTDITIPEYFGSMDTAARERLLTADSIARESNLGGTIEETISKLGNAKPSEIEELIELIRNGRAGVIRKFTEGDGTKIHEYYQNFNPIGSARQAGVGEKGIKIIESLIGMYIREKFSLEDSEARLMYNVFDRLIPNIVNEGETDLSTALQASVLRNIARDFIRASMINEGEAMRLAIKEPNKGFLELIGMKADRKQGQSFSEIIANIVESVQRTRESINQVYVVDFNEVFARADVILRSQAALED